MEPLKLKPDALARLLGHLSDLTLVLDAQGRVEDVSLARAELTVLGCQEWLGKPWLDTVTSESRAKVSDLLELAKQTQDTGWRHINHALPSGHDVAIEYCAVALDDNDKTLVMGRDLEELASLQRRLIETQQSMERDFVRLRHVESRYRILLDTSLEPILLVDANSDKVLDANLAATALSRDSQRRLVGRDVLECFEAQGRDELRTCLRTALATGRIEMSRVRWQGASADSTVSCVVFRQEDGAQLLLRLHSQDPAAARPAGAQADWMQEMWQRAPVGVVITDRQGRVREANNEFIQMMAALSLGQLQGQTIENWLRRDAVDWGVLNTHLRQQREVKGFATQLRSMSGLQMAVDIAAISLQAQDLYVFFVRDAERLRTQETPASAVGMAGTVTELAGLVGRMPMKDIVGETIDMIERSCIQSALTLTQNNRASAAEMLGLSRQSLYVKLRRFGMVAEEESA